MFESIDYKIEKLPSGKDVFDWCNQMESRWHAKFISEVSDHTLKRYFDYHLKGISALPDAFNLENGTAVNQLINHLWLRYEKFLDPKVNAPAVFSAFNIQELLPAINNFGLRIKNIKLSIEMRDCLDAYFLLFVNQQKRLFRYADIFYLRAVLKELDAINPIGLSESSINKILSRCNFNSLDYLLYRQETIRRETPIDPFKKIKYLSRCKGENKSIPVNSHISYDSDWPDLSEMLDKWLEEELALAWESQRFLTQNPVAVVMKMPLNISVAHLACLIKVFLETHLLPEEGFASTFRFFSAHFKTKRQDHISHKSLSKEFYAIDQFTAAAVRGKLLEMVDWINRSYFPVWVVTGATFLFL